MKHKFPAILLIVLMIVGFFYRIYGLRNNFSFWSDEEHVAIFVRAIFERGRPVLSNGYSTGIFQYLQYWLAAFSSLVFGLNEFGIRFPSIIFGTLTIGAVYLLGKELFGQRVGLLAAFLTTFLKIEILWSRQARPYQGLQLFCLLAAWFLCRLSKKGKVNWPNFLGFLLTGVLATLLHGFGLLIFLVGGLYFSIWLPRQKQAKWTLGILIFSAGMAFLFKDQVLILISQLGRVNNVPYYLVFLGHNYWFLTVLAAVGLIGLVIRQEKGWPLPFLFLSAGGIIISFFLRQPFTRYPFIVFPFLILLTAAGLEEILRLGQQKWQKFIWLSLLVLLLFITKDKLAFLPTENYSLNMDMREIPEVDWNRIYALVKAKMPDKEIVLLVNWSDLPVWFLGEGKLDYLVRAVPTPGESTDPLSGAPIISSLADFKKVTTQKKVLVVFDSWDDCLPREIRDYVEENFRKELVVDRLYPVQPRYWPVTVYSWGGN